jgi:electron transfer flavoprotein alpha subunit
MSIVLVFCDAKDGKFKSVTFEALAGAKRIADGLSASVVAVTIGSIADAALLGGYGVIKVIQVTNPELSAYSTEGYAQAAAEVIKSENPVAVVFSATSRGHDLGPRVAARVGHTLLADCTDLKIENDELRALRPIYGGKVQMWAKVTGGCPILSLRPKAFLAQSVNGNAAEVENRTVALDTSKIRARVIEEKVQSGGALDLTEADAIVSGGRGMKGPENFTLIEDLAKALGATVGASRAVVDAGWRPHSDQVGQTGKVVSPTLYVAVAISGAVQHLAGMNTSRVIVAINKDKDAPIFKVATYGIVGDAFQVVPKLTEEINKIRA